MPVFRVDIPYSEKAMGGAEPREHTISYMIDSDSWIEALSQGVQRFEDVSQQDFHGWICRLHHDHVQVTDFVSGKTFRLAGNSPQAPNARSLGGPRDTDAAWRADAHAALVKAADGPIDGSAARILAALASAVDVDASAVLLIDPKASDLYFAATTGPKSTEVSRLRISSTKGIAGFCARTGQAISVDNAALTPLFDPEVSEVVGYPTGAIAAAPVKRDGAVVGAVEVLNPRGRETFNRDELGLVVAAGVLVGLALVATTASIPTVSQPH